MPASLYNHRVCEALTGSVRASPGEHSAKGMVCLFGCGPEVRSASIGYRVELLGNKCTFEFLLLSEGDAT